MAKPKDLEKKTHSELLRIFGELSTAEKVFGKIEQLGDDALMVEPEKEQTSKFKSLKKLFKIG